MSLFNANKNGICFYIFNKKSNKERIDEILNELKRFKYVPKWHNILALKGDKEWWEVCFPKLKEASEEVAWADMPKEMEDYIRSLPEFNEEIFNEITGRKCNDK